jgi:hypothetical protein
VTWEHRGELRADPGSAPGERNFTTRPAKQGSIWPSIAVVAAAGAFGGVIWFAYHNGHESPGGGLPPLVKAEAGPVKVKPDQPGGQEIPFQDSTVYDRLGQGGTQKPAVEKILPPPEAPVERPQPAPVPAQASAALPPDATPEPRLPPAPDSLPPPNDSSPTALAPPPGAPTVPLTPPPHPPATVARRIAPPEPPKPTQAAVLKPKPSPAAAQPHPAPAKPAEHTKPGQATSIAALESRALASFDETHPQAAPPAAHKAGGYHVQLSSVRDHDLVAPEWARLKQRFPELASLGISSGKADVQGKGTFYRLQAGPLDEAGAKSMCEHLRAQGSACIVVKP